MIHNNQFSYDYRDEPMFAECVEWVTLELACGRDWQNLSSATMSTYLDYTDKGYQKALKWVCEHLTEEHYLEFLREFGEE